MSRPAQDTALAQRKALGPMWTGATFSGAARKYVSVPSWVWSESTTVTRSARPARSVDVDPLHAVDHAAVGDGDLVADAQLALGLEHDAVADVDVRAEPDRPAADLQADAVHEVGALPELEHVGAARVEVEVGVAAELHALGRSCSVKVRSPSPSGRMSTCGKPSIRAPWGASTIRRAPRR